MNNELELSGWIKEHGIQRPKQPIWDFIFHRVKTLALVTCKHGHVWREGDNWHEFGGNACKECCNTIIIKDVEIK